MTYSEYPERNIELFFSHWSMLELGDTGNCDYIVCVMVAALCNMLLWIAFHPKIASRMCSGYISYCMPIEI